MQLEHTEQMITQCKVVLQLIDHARPKTVVNTTIQTTEAMNVLPRHRLELHWTKDLG